MAARGAALLRTACFLTCRHADAEDLVQTVLTRAYAVWDGIADKRALDRYMRQALVTISRALAELRADRALRDELW